MVEQYNYKGLAGAHQLFEALPSAVWGQGKKLHNQKVGVQNHEKCTECIGLLIVH